jgi:hypothetical protein
MVLFSVADCSPVREVRSGAAFNEESSLPRGWDMQVALGFKSSQGVVKEFGFCLDPDGTSLPWFRFTGRALSVEGCVEIGTDSRTYSGMCDDTSEYTSHLGELMQELLRIAPEGTVMMVVETESGCGTRTFSERASATYYK